MIKPFIEKASVLIALGKKDEAKALIDTVLGMDATNQRANALKASL